MVWVWKTMARLEARLDRVTKEYLQQVNLLRQAVKRLNDSVWRHFTEDETAIMKALSLEVERDSQFGRVPKERTANERAFVLRWSLELLSLEH